MPTYEYECAECGVVFERFQQMTDEPVKNCPECGGKVKRLLGAGGAVIFKGGSPTNSRKPPCGRDAPCCGRDTPCSDGSCSVE